MKINLIKRKTLEDFAQQHARSRNALSIFLTIIKMADWSTTEDISESFGSADLLGNGSNRVVFDIAGNHYRMICAYHFGSEMIHLYIKWMGTHAEYSKLCNQNKQFTINKY
ncbi:MAG: type II toxin-antitoxin system HigB family toxin [Bacteroidota bacterium]|jgi:mRNA interferase HigB